MQRIEWTTLLFFGSMFVTMECLARLGLITWIGQQTETLILCVGKDAQLAVAIVIVLWVCYLRRWNAFLFWQSCKFLRFQH